MKSPLILPEPQINRPYVKICGLTNADDALLAASLGASFLGIILTQKSKRHVPEEKARELINTIRASSDALIFGVFVDETSEEIIGLAERLSLDAVQIHGDVSQHAPRLAETMTIPAVSIRGEEDATALDGLAPGYPALLADAFAAGAHGGTGKLFDHRYVQPLFAKRRIFLAGGLKPENIEEVAERLGDAGFPYALDLSSGVEAEPGRKSPEKLKAFFDAWKRIPWKR